MPVRRSIAWLVFLLPVIGTTASAAPWAIVTTGSDRTIMTVDLGSTPPTVFGPFSPAEFVLSGGLGGVAVVPGGRFAVVKNTSGPLYLVDITNPRLPVPVATINTRELGSDVAISSDGRFAIPTFEVLFVVADLASGGLSGRVLIDPPLMFPNCVAIAPDNATVLFCDAANHQLAFGKLNSERTDLESYGTVVAGEPVNATAAGDGRTLLVGNGDDTVSVYRIASPGVVVPGNPPTVSGLPGTQASLAVNPRNGLIYVLSTSPSPDRISLLEVTGPGSVAVARRDTFTLTSDADSLSGVERMAITPAGDRLVVGSVVSSTLTMVDLSTGRVSTISMNGSIPYGVAAFEGPISPGERIPTLSTSAVVLFVVMLGTVGTFLLTRRG